MLRSPAKAKKTIRINCALSADSLHLDIVEKHSSIDSGSNPLFLAFSRTRTDVVDYLKVVLAGYTQINHQSEAAKDLCQSYVILSTRNTTNDEMKLQHNELAIRLSADPRELLILLGSIDLLLQHLKYHDHYDGYDISFYYHGRQLAQDKLSISRQIAGWMLDTIQAHKEIQQRYQEIVPVLEDLLKVESLSLSHAIRTQLFPRTSLGPAIREQVKNKEDFELFNPESKYPAKVQSMQAWLQKKLGEKSPKNARVAKHDNAIHEEINARFTQIEQHQLAIWALMVQSLKGEFAADGGCYLETYTEIRLLMEAQRTLNEQGLMTLSYHESKSYLDVYQKKNANNELAVDATILGQELTLACAHLNLEFEPGQSFHPGPAVFSKASTRELKRLGLHWNKEYGTKLIKCAMLFRAMERDTPLPADIITKILRMNDDTLPQEEVRALARKDPLR